jgi:hypothetical protein
MKCKAITYFEKILYEIDRDIIAVKDSLVKGSILSFQWNDQTDIDILIEVDEYHVQDEEHRRKIQDKINDKYGHNYPGTEHPLQFYVLPGKYNPENADGIYHLEHGWVKGPYNITVNVDNYMEQFKNVVDSIDISTGQLKRNIIDYEMLKKLPADEITNLSSMLESKLDEINDDVEGIVNQFQHIKDMRHQAFNVDMTPEQIIEYGSKNSLPENVIFKMLEKYYYLQFMYELKTLGEIEHHEVDDVKDAVKNSI